MDSLAQINRDSLFPWEYLGYLFYLTFNRDDLLFDCVFLSDDRRGGAAVTAPLPSNRINHVLLTLRELN